MSQYIAHMNSQPIYIQSNNDQHLINQPIRNQPIISLQAHQAEIPPNQPSIPTQQTEIPPKENNEDIIMDIHGEMGQSTVAGGSDSSNPHSNSVCIFAIINCHCYFFSCNV